MLTRLLELNLPALLPWGDSCPYDVVYLKGKRFVKAQVKSGRIRNNAVRFKAHIWNPFKKEGASYLGKVDEFLVYCFENDTIYRVPVKECTSWDGFLRLSPSKNSQVSGVKFAKDYVL